MTIQPGILGTSAGKVQMNCITKPSSFFPDSWDEFKIIDKTIESLFRIVEIKIESNGLRIWGKTSEDIVIQLILRHGGLISTLFPTLDYKG